MKYRPGDNTITIKVTNDIKTISIKFNNRNDTAKVELLLVKSSEILANYKHTGELASKCYLFFRLNPCRRGKKKQD
jgi:hypothetical protein